MRTAVDTNIFIGLFSGEEAESQAAQQALETAAKTFALTISAVVHAELLAGDRSSQTLDEFFSGKGIEVHWELSEEVWRTAGVRYGRYAEHRRRQSGDSGPRRILADFLIGAHAFHLGGSRLLTTDQRIFSSYFPEVEVISPGSG